VITVKADSSVDEAAVVAAFEYLLAKAKRMPPDHRIEWVTAHVNASRLAKG
jgi:hypothetical protein